MDELIMFKKMLWIISTNNITIWLGPTTIDISCIQK
jgi:hypothetical protein